MVARPGKYAHIERERRFLLAEAPVASMVTATRSITDRYVIGTRLRLRRIEATDGGVERKLTQKVPLDQPGAVQGLITTMYLSVDEYDALAGLPAHVLTKTRHSIGVVGVDVFAGELCGLVLAEAEFETDDAAESFAPPTGCVVEVTDDVRFTGGALVTTTRHELQATLAALGVTL